MAGKDEAKGVEAAEVGEVRDQARYPDGMRMDEGHHADKPARMPAAPKGKEGRWEEARVSTRTSGA